MSDPVGGLPPVCILAGGLGTRLGPLTRQLPKGLIEVAGRPFLLHQLELLAAHGASRIVLCVGHLGRQVRERIGRSQFGLGIEYSSDGPGLDGTLGAIRRAQGLLGERFLYLYGDTYLRIDYAAANASWEASGAPAMMTVLENSSAWGVSNAAFDGRFVTRYDKANPGPELGYIDYGLGGLSAEALAAAEPDEHDLAALHHRLAERGALCGYEATERFYEIGTPAALEETDRFLRTIPAPLGAGGQPSRRT